MIPSLKGATVGVVGAGAMGSGIAQIALAHEHKVVLVDTDQKRLQQAKSNIEKGLIRWAEKGKIQGAVQEIISNRLQLTSQLEDVHPAQLVIEAIVEDFGAKSVLFENLEHWVDGQTILATNTSSLSVTRLAARCKKPHRVCGMHFFNPAPLLPLVEVVPAMQSDANLCEAVRQLALAWGKKPVLTRDTPGFIVNRLARPFYGEALRIYEEQLATPAEIDAAMKTEGGFKMGPFELMDLIGNDINYAVSKSVFEAFHFDPRYRPSLVQQRMVDAGWLGRKTGRGYFAYGDDTANTGSAQAAHPQAKAIFMRILCMLINEACEALHLAIASADDLDTAVQAGVNYPKGLLAWGDELGAKHVLETLVGLHSAYGDDRYRPSVVLHYAARTGRPLAHYTPGTAGILPSHA